MKNTNEHNRKKCVLRKKTMHEMKGFRFSMVGSMFFVFIFFMSAMNGVSWCSKASLTTALSESFDGTTFPPTGWARWIGSGSYNWARTTSGTHPTQSPHSGAGEAYYDSYDASSGSNVVLATPNLNLPSKSNVTLSFWMYRDTGYPSYNDRIEVHYSTTSQTTLGPLVTTFSRYATSNYWDHKTNIYLGIFTGTIYVQFRAISAYGDNMFIDDVLITYNNPPGVPVLDSKQQMDNALLPTTTPRLKWSVPTDLNGDNLNFRIQIATDTAFTNLVVNKLSTNPTGFGGSPNSPPNYPQGVGVAWYDVQAGDGLANGNTYWWRVCAYDGTVYGDWTLARSFTIDTSQYKTGWKQTTSDQFASDTFVNTHARGSPNNDVILNTSTPTGEGMIAYGEYNTPTPKYRLWTGSAWGSAQNALSIGADVVYLVLRACPVRNEYALGTLDFNGAIKVQIYNGTSGTWGNLKTLTTNCTYNAYRGFDLAYMTYSGKLMAVVDNTTVNPLYYVWDGKTWTSSPMSISITTSNYPIWIEMKSNPVTDEIVLAIEDGRYELFSAVWNGNAWGNIIQLETNVNGRNGQSFDIAYESQNHQAMVIWAYLYNTNLYYRLWTGTAWSSESALSLGSSYYVYWVRLAPDPSSNKIGLGVYDNDNSYCRVKGDIWSGTAWGTISIRYSSAYYSNPIYSKRMDSVYEKSGSLAMLVWGIGDDGYDNPYTPLYSRYTTSWQSYQAAQSISAYTRVVQLTPNPNSDEITLAVGDNSEDLNVQRWTGSAWTGNTELSTNLASIYTDNYAYEGFMYAYRTYFMTGTGTLTSPPIYYNNTQDSSPPPEGWGQVSWTALSGGGTSNVSVRVQYWTGTGWAEIGGKSSNNSAYPIDLTSLNASVYSEIRLVATFTAGTGGAPALEDWTVKWRFNDSDCDGLPDWWEKNYGLDPYNATGINGANGDPDGDGFTNLEEYHMGTSPISPNFYGNQITLSHNLTVKTNLYMQNCVLTMNSTASHNYNINIPSGAVANFNNVTFQAPSNSKGFEINVTGIASINNCIIKYMGGNGSVNSSGIKANPGSHLFINSTTILNCSIGLTLTQSPAQVNNVTIDASYMGIEFINDDSLIRNATITSQRWSLFILSGSNPTIQNCSYGRSQVFVQDTADTMNDGLTDGYDIYAYGLNPNHAGNINVDSDGDGLTNVQEVGYAINVSQVENIHGNLKILYGGTGTNPFSADTDSDGIPDNVELGYGAVTWMEAGCDGRPVNEPNFYWLYPPFVYDTEVSSPPSSYSHIYGGTYLALSSKPLDSYCYFPQRVTTGTYNIYFRAVGLVNIANDLCNVSVINKNGATLAAQNYKLLHTWRFYLLPDVILSSSDAPGSIVVHYIGDSGSSMGLESVVIVQSGYKGYFTNPFAIDTSFDGLTDKIKYDQNVRWYEGENYLENGGQLIKDSTANLGWAAGDNSNNALILFVGTADLPPNNPSSVGPYNLLIRARSPNPSGGLLCVQTSTTSEQFIPVSNTYTWYSYQLPITFSNCGPNDIEMFGYSFINPPEPISIVYVDKFALVPSSYMPPISGTSVGTPIHVVADPLDPDMDWDGLLNGYERNQEYFNVTSEQHYDPSQALSISLTFSIDSYTRDFKITGDFHNDRFSYTYVEIWDDNNVKLFTSQLYPDDTMGSRRFVIDPTMITNGVNTIILKYWGQGVNNPDGYISMEHVIVTYAAYTNPFSTDSDHDGRLDFDEIHEYNSNPTDSTNTNPGTEASYTEWNRHEILKDSLEIYDQWYGGQFNNYKGDWYKYDSEKLMNELVSKHANTLVYLLGRTTDNPWDWTELFNNILSKAEEYGIKVIMYWGYGINDYPQGYSLQTWGLEMSKLSDRYPNFIGFAMDDFNWKVYSSDPNYRLDESNYIPFSQNLRHYNPYFVHILTLYHYALVDDDTSKQNFHGDEAGRSNIGNWVNSNNGRVNYQNLDSDLNLDGIWFPFFDNSGFTTSSTKWMDMWDGIEQTHNGITTGYNYEVNQLKGIIGNDVLISMFYSSELWGNHFTLGAPPSNYIQQLINEATNNNNNDGIAIYTFFDQLSNPPIENGWRSIDGAFPLTDVQGGTQWTGQYLSMAVDDSGAEPVTHFAYYDANPNPAIGMNLKYARYDSNWNPRNPTIQTIDNLGDVGKYTSLALDENNLPHISYYAEDQTNPGNYELKHAWFDGNNWHIETILDTSSDYGLFTSIAFNKTVIPWVPSIAYYDNTNHAIKCAHKSGSTWIIDTIEMNPAYRCLAISLAFDGSIPRIIYFWMDIALISGKLKYSYKFGSSWSTQIIDNDPSYYDITSLSLAIDRATFPLLKTQIAHVSYVKIIWTGSAWKYELWYAVLNIGFPNYWTHQKVTNLVVPTASGSVFEGFYTSIALTSNDNQVIAFSRYDWDPNSYGPVMQVCLLKHENGGSIWHGDDSTHPTEPCIIENGEWVKGYGVTNQVGGYINIAIDKNNNYHAGYEWIRYDDGAGTGLKYYMPLDYQRYWYSQGKGTAITNGYIEWREKTI